MKDGRVKEGRGKGKGRGRAREEQEVAGFQDVLRA